MRRTDTGTILTTHGLRKRFRGIEVLNGVSLAVARGQVTALIGSNGAGKSTLFNLVSGLHAPDAGRISLGERDVTRLPAYARGRLGLARTFQHPRSFGSLTVRECVLLAATPAPEEGLLPSLLRSAGDRSARIEAALERCQIAHRAEARAAALGYGEQKLLMLAQVLAQEASLFCFDELCAGLEPALVERVQAIVRALVVEGKSVLFIEHNLKLVRELADGVVFLHQGTVFRAGPAAQVLEDPEVVRLYLGQ
jgi:ABC-type branched-subunit amino acid transport system ATPase component